MQQETQWGPSCPQSRWSLREERDPLLIFFSLFIGRIKFGAVYFKKIYSVAYSVNLLCFGFQYLHVQTFLVCLKLPWNILVLCNIFKLWKQKISIAQRVKESLAKKYLMNLLQEEGPLPGPETGLLSNTWKWIVRGDTCWQSKRFYWERAPGWRAVGKGTQENCSAAHSLGSYGDGISFRVVFGQSF